MSSAILGRPLPITHMNALQPSQTTLQGPNLAEPKGQIASSECS